MTNEEPDKEITATWDRANKRWNSLSDEEKKEAEKAENSRLWEDWTDVQPIFGADKKQSDH